MLVLNLVQQPIQLNNTIHTHLIDSWHIHTYTYINFWEIFGDVGNVFRSIVIRVRNDEVKLMGGKSVK